MGRLILRVLPAVFLHETKVISSFASEVLRRALKSSFFWLMRKDLVELCCDGLKTLLPEDELQNKIGGGALVEDDKAKRSALEESY